MKDSFLLYTSHYPTLQLLTLEEKGMLLDVVFQYHITGKLPEIESFSVKMAFSFLKQQFDRDTEKYQRVVERNKANIDKRWNKEDTKNTTGKNGIPNDTKNTTGKNGIPNDTKNTDNGNGNGNGNDLKPPISPKGDNIIFDEFRKLYPGNKRSLETEFTNFKKKHKDWNKILPLLLPAVEKEIAYHKQKKSAGEFVSEYANLQTWINQRRWEIELPNITTNETTKPRRKAADIL